MINLIPQKWREKIAVPSPFKKKDWLTQWWDNPWEDYSIFSGEPLFKRYPHTQVNESHDNINVKIDLPGINAKDIDLSWQNGILHIEGESKNENKKNHKGNYYEYSYNRVCRNIEVGKNVAWEKAKAKYKNGVLQVTLPKTKSAQKAIEIKVD